MNTRTTAFLFSLPCAFLLAPFGDAIQEDAKLAKATARDGLNIAYDARGKGDTALVFVHGFCCDRESWKHQMAEFARDYRVVAIDLAGHGESGKDRQQWSVPGFAGDVEAVIKAHGLKRVILVGHSMGGPVSLETAKRLPGVVVGVIGADTLQNVEFKWEEEQAKEFLASFEKDPKGAMRAAIKGMLPEKVDPELLKSITTKADAADPKMAVAVMRDFPRVDSKSLLKDAKVPVRCINSGPGFQFAMPTLVEVNKKYGDFNAVIIDGVGHYPMQEKPAEFNQKLREILKEFDSKK